MLQSLFSIEGKRAVVTGAGRGIGQMIAKTFVGAGADVFIVCLGDALFGLTSRNAEACREAAAAMTAEGPGTCTALAPQDLSREAGVKAFVEELGDKTSSLDILVNNSGTSWGQPFESYPEQAFDKLFALNVTGVFCLTRECLPLLKAASSSGDPSRVINISSIAGLMPQPVPTFAYDASKAAVIQLTKKLATELAPDVTVNAICPGFVPSKMSAQLLTYASEEAIRKAIPLGRWGSQEDMGGAAMFLASRAGAWVTGTAVPVDGGTVARPFVGMEEEE